MGFEMRYALLFLAFVLLGCSSPEVDVPQDTGSKPLKTITNPNYMIELTKVNNSDDLMVFFDVINTNSNEYSYTISDAVVVTDSGKQLGVRGLGDNCEGWKKVDLSIPRSLYPDARTTYKLCFQGVKSDARLHIKMKSKDKSRSVTDELMEGRIMGKETEHTIELARFLTLPKASQETMSIEEVKLEDKSFEILIKNNDLVDYDGFYMMIEKDNEEGSFSMPVHVDKRIVQGRYIRIDTSKDLLDIDSGEPYELRNIQMYDRFTFTLYSGNSENGLYGELGSASHEVAAI